MLKGAFKKLQDYLARIEVPEQDPDMVRNEFNVVTQEQLEKISFAYYTDHNGDVIGLHYGKPINEDDLKKDIEALKDIRRFDP